MADWVLKGLRTGIKTTLYPERPEMAPGVTPGRPLGTLLKSAEKADRLAEFCPTDAIARNGRGVAVNFERCVHCFRCHPDAGDESVNWDSSYEWAAEKDEMAAARQKLDSIFGRSLYLRFVDAGACGACVSEARQLNNPYYNMHRLGFFTTPTPRNADVLLVAGPVSDAMRVPLRQAYHAMPEPKRVIAMGACALFGGVFGPSFAASGGVAEIIPVDVEVPGCPPPPLAILHALLVVVDRKPPAQLMSPAPKKEAQVR
jgi:Ni,Fe-hydrogenase III small subunit/NAD-dependent dihydropyrimidine dehydrogenase PreA subunit